MLDIQFSQATDFGKVRTNNEDAMGSFIPSSHQQARIDGLHDGLSNEDLGRIVSQNRNIDEIARGPVTRAVELDGNDNTTAQVIRIREVEQIGMYRGLPYRLPG